eukprot:TRINITY_DN16004_c0_g1_i1.p1 TRINITY_DN16004_c0_g1~~TRINITY_DN16004_c0_g1_i1.p1  ORF type:complete len:121 (-),score=22.12 TRINITY_DN16004_c0_g1_i1:45-407(-)
MANFEAEVNKLRSIQSELQTLAQSRGQYLTQLHENEEVNKELGFLGDTEEVFKLMGPVLVKQDLGEAKANVKTRIEYIQAELKKLENTSKDLDKKLDAQREKVMAIQATQQQAAPQAMKA